MRSHNRRSRGNGDPRPAATRGPRVMHGRCPRSQRRTRRCGRGAPVRCRREPGRPCPSSPASPDRGTRRLRSSGSLEDALRALGHRVPHRQRLPERGPAAVREPVVLPRHPARRLLPSTLDEPPFLETSQRGIEGSLLEVEKPVRPVAQLAEDLEPVLLLLVQEREQAQLDRALLQLRGPLGGDFRHPVRLVSDRPYFGFRSWMERGVAERSTSDRFPPGNAVIGLERERKRGGAQVLRLAFDRKYRAGPMARETTANWAARIVTGVRFTPDGRSSNASVERTGSCTIIWPAG